MIARSDLTLLITAGVCALAASGLWGQVPEQNLREPEATYAEGFGLVRGVRELADGRVLVADPLGQALVIADLDAGTADTLGGVGQGPGEYRQPDGLFALPGDSTLLVDLGNARLTVVDPSGRFGETMPMTQGEPGPGGGFLIVVPQAVDSYGRLYFQPFGGRMGPALPDSGVVVRLDRASGAMDTVARFKLPELKRSTSGGPSNRSVSISPVPLSPEDAWAVAADGSVVAARSGDYHLEWLRPNGGSLHGPPVEYRPVKIRQADKEDWLESLSNGLQIGVMIQNGDRRVSLSRGGSGSRAARSDADRFDWPEVKPPFVSDGVWVTPEGEVWVQRHVEAGDLRAFDVFGTDARVKRRVTIPADRELVGFGRGTLYAVRTDDLGLGWLERYRRY